MHRLPARPTSPPPAGDKSFMSIKISNELVAKLEDEKIRTGMSKSKIVREVLNMYFEEE